jgi:hypothetical protein
VELIKISPSFPAWISLKEIPHGGPPNFSPSSETAPKQLILESLDVAQFSCFLRKLYQIVVGEKRKNWLSILLKL